MIHAVFASKRAVSPLVATVLLIAFAVALGAVVMSWSGQVASNMNTCKELSLKFEEIAGVPDICFSPTEETIFVTVRNGPTDLEGLSTTVIGSRSSSTVDSVIQIPAYAIQKVAIPYAARQYGTPKKVVTMPFFSRSSGDERCNEQAIEWMDIPTCSA